MTRITITQITVSRNHPDEVDDVLLASARQILQTSKNTFEVRPWREIMTKATAKETSKALKDAEKKAAAKGITKPRHQVLMSTEPKLMTSAEISGDAKYAGFKPAFPSESGVDKGGEDVVQSSNGANSGSESTTSGETNMTETTKTDSRASEAQAAKEAATKAKIAEKEAKQKATADKKAAAEAEKAKKAEERKAAMEAKAKERAEKEAARKAELEASGSKRTYIGSMLTLADRVKAGVYVKGTNGQLRSNDDVAIALEACSAKNVVKLLTELLKSKEVAHKDYSALNIGQQSMNLRNVLRGAIKAGKVSIDELKAARDAGNYADAEAELAAKREAKAKRDAERDAAKLAKEAAKSAPKAEAAPAQAAA